MNTSNLSGSDPEVFDAIMQDEFNFGGRQKACKGQGLSGKEKRECAKKLKASGWKKGQPIPTDMSGITHEDVAQAEKDDASAKTGEGAGMSGTTKVLIGAGILVAVVGGFFLIKSMKKAKTSK